MNTFRHGDVDLLPIESLPSNLKPVETLTLAYGEKTGHHHSFAVADRQKLQIFEDEKGNKYIDIREPSSLTHQEHKTLTITPGFFQVKIEQEFDPYTKELSKVQD